MDQRRNYILGPELRARLRPKARFRSRHDLLVPEIGLIRPLAFRASGLFIDIGVPEDYPRVQQMFSQRPAR